MNPLPQSSTRGTRHLVASADQLAARAGDAIFSKGGNAVDAAIATNAAIAVTCPHLCGLGGDLFALIHDGHSVHALNSSGRAGSGANADQLRAEGLTTLPFRHDIRVVTMPGCIDGWVALNERFGSMPLTEVIQPAIDLAEYGFPASPLLVGAVRQLDSRGAEALHELSSQATSVGAVVRRPGVARALRAVASGGRDGFYLGEFGQSLKELGNGLFHDRDLEQSSAEWVTPLTSSAFGVDLHTIPPNSQGYLTLGAASLLDGITLERPMMIVGHISLSKHRRSPDLIALKSWAIAPMAMNFSLPSQRGETCSTSMQQARLVFARQMEIRHISVPRRPMGTRSLLSSRMQPGLDAGLQNPTRRSICTIEDSGFPLSPAIQRYSGQVGAPRIPCRQHLQPVTGSLCRYSARWEEMLSHKFFCRSQPACFNINSHPQKQFTPPAGLSPDRRLDSIRGTTCHSSRCYSRVIRRLPGGNALPPAVIAYACNQSGIQHLDMPTPSFVTSMVLPEPPIRELGSARALDANSSSAIHSTSTRVPTSANDQRNSAS